MDNSEISRRSFVGTMGSMAGGAFAFTIVPRHVLGGPGFVAPSDRVNVAVVGAGAQGMSNARALVAGGQNIAVLCDVDFGFVDRQVAAAVRPRPANPNAPAPTPQQAAQQAQQAEVAQKMAEQYGKAKRYADVRVMLEKEKGIDGVVIATPDHFHAVAANAAMQSGKAVYVQKPLTWSVHEARTLAATAKRTGVVTQMGNQGHSFDGTRQMVEWIAAGLIGPVREVHVWTNRPIWPQGVPRPTTEPLWTPPRQGGPLAAAAGGVRAMATPAAQTSGPAAGDVIDWSQRDVQRNFAKLMARTTAAPPPGLNWDIFLGPAPLVPYHPIYHPFNWRGWTDWGMGALGDMGAHLIDQPFWALNLDVPTSIEATSSPFGMDVDESPATYPQTMTVHYEFAARGDQPPVKMSWYDGGLMPPRPDYLPDEIVLDRAGGGIFVGSKGIILYETYGNNPRLFPEGLRADAARVPQTVKRVTTSHEINWANAIMKKAEPSSDFAYAAKLTETMLLGVAALRTGQGVKLKYDGANMRFTNSADANQYLQREYRAGWSL